MYIRDVTLADFVNRKHLKSLLGRSLGKDHYTIIEETYFNHVYKSNFMRKSTFKSMWHYPKRSNYDLSLKNNLNMLLVR